MLLRGVSEVRGTSGIVSFKGEIEAVYQNFAIIYAISVSLLKEKRF